MTASSPQVGVGDKTRVDEMSEFEVSLLATGSAELAKRRLQVATKKEASIKGVMRRSVRRLWSKRLGFGIAWDLLEKGTD